jgi:hypothetical protein
MCFAYNCDLYYRDYFPDYDLGWWLFAVTIVIGSIGVVVGGIVSDKFVAKMGIRSRVACLAISQIIATPFAFGSLYFNPLWAMITLGISYFFGKFPKSSRRDDRDDGHAIFDFDSVRSRDVVRYSVCHRGGNRTPESAIDHRRRFLVRHEQHWRQPADTRRTHQDDHRFPGIVVHLLRRLLRYQ